MNTKEALQAVGVAVDALPLIRKMLGVGSDKADAVIAGAGAALDAVIAGLDGSASPQEVLLRVEALHQALLANDAAADSALDAKFRGGGA